MIKIPERLMNKLEENQEWTINVNAVILNVKDLYISTPYFFQEYTNHGVLHVNHILDIANKLIPDETLNTMTEKELGISIISLVLHDIGMFVSYGGFMQLIADKEGHVDLEDEKTFEDSWKEYLAELKYYSEKQLNNKFGTIDIGTVTWESINDLDNKTKLVIGEFLRQNHHHISHYIIKHGIEQTDFLNGTSMDDKFRDLIGLIARSHGMDMRDTEGYLSSQYASFYRPKNVNIFYIMALVRMADYLDAGVERAPHIYRTFYVKMSENSRREFSWNQCIGYEDFVWEEEKERILVDAMPKNSGQFIDVRYWTKGIQYELDMSWAILGEHYDVNKYKLSIRRIQCNISQKEVIADYEKKFHTQETYLDANADILKLLIAPLYGDNPSYGVREILQNAVDACREREKKESRQGREYKGKVRVYVDTKQRNIIFVDNGIGMKIDVIKKYYLIAGASYRRSDAWSKEFAESDGKTRILRNGKFGIGVLATFLLGEKATIITRSMDEEMGWEFSIQLDQGNIEVKRVQAEIGTEISIDMPESVMEPLLSEGHLGDFCAWNEWYVGKNPSVTYYVDGVIKNTYRPVRNIKWYELDQTEYKKYAWSLSHTHSYFNREVICNDIIIPNTVHFVRDGMYRFNIPMPSVNIEDWEGKIPVDLARAKLVEIPCKEKLYTECCKYYLAKILSLDFKPNKEIKRYKINHYAWEDGAYIIHSKRGYTLCDAAFIGIAKIRELHVLFTSGRSKNDNLFTVIDSDYPFVFHDLPRKGVSKDLFENILSGNFSLQGIKKGLSILHIDKKSFDYVKDRLEKPKWRYLNIQKKKMEYTILPTRKDIMSQISFDIDEFPMVAEYIITAVYLNKRDIMYNILKEYMGNEGFIPYDLEERKKKYPKAFDELSKYMDL